MLKCSVQIYKNGDTFTLRYVDSRTFEVVEKEILDINEMSKIFKQSHVGLENKNVGFLI